MFCFGFKGEIFIISLKIVVVDRKYYHCLVYGTTSSTLKNGKIDPTILKGSRTLYNGLIYNQPVQHVFLPYRDVGGGDTGFILK